MLLRVFLISICFFTGHLIHAQQIPIQNYSVNANNQAVITVNSSVGKYYLLRVKHHPDSAFTITSAIKLGQAGTTTLTEPLRAYPVDHYQVSEYSVTSPSDNDGDGQDDISELNDMPYKGPLNAASSIPAQHGQLTANSFAEFHQVSKTENNQEFSKFIIFDFFSSAPKIYFINCNVYNLHLDFANYLGLDPFAATVRKGFVSYHPSVLAPNGKLGTYSFHYSNDEGMDFEIVQRTQELLAANMPYLTNNLSYFITANNETDYQNDILKYQNSRVSVLFQSDVYAGINYWGLNQTEGYGFLRSVSPQDLPGSRDIVLYNTLPNSLPRVGGIITSVIQTPLSHVNLRAIQNNIPNAFIRDPLNISTISNLLDHYIYFKAGQSTYEIREATLEEVNAWYDKIRPVKEQIPLLNLSHDSILPLEKITFKMFDGFGAKTANVATMRTFGFAEGTIPNGFGVPFYFYQEFMKYNNFFDKIKLMLSDPDFISNRTIREAKLVQLQKQIKSAPMPTWMLDQLTEMQNSFPAGTSVRCRSSTNNEDLPGFSGAGLYDSKTHHVNEGHISKTIKQIYASLWNFRAFEERDFSRVNHFYASMGVLCHPNFDGEKVNGVGVTADPVYDTEGTLYLNSQMGEELITNPGSTLPEEVLLKRNPGNDADYAVVQYSSIFNGDTLLMTNAQMDLLRQYMLVIHERFETLYNAENNASFAIDIEFKIDKDDKLAIKQARPWVTYRPSMNGINLSDNCSFSVFPNPATNAINVLCESCGASTIQITDMNGGILLEKKVQLNQNLTATISVDELPAGVYIIKEKSTSCRVLKLIKK